MKNMVNIENGNSEVIQIKEIDEFLPIDTEMSVCTFEKLLNGLILQVTPRGLNSNQFILELQKIKELT